MIRPMLAVPMHKGTITNWNEWAIERKYDGWRLIVDVSVEKKVQAWTRPRAHAGAAGKTMLEQELPLHLQVVLARLPVGTYDGELIAGLGGTSSDVARLDRASSLRFVVFDVLRQVTGSTMALPYDARRTWLQGAFDYLDTMGWRSDHVILAPSHPLTCAEDVTTFVQAVWQEGGEGAILKRRAARYVEGKRSPDFIKVKKLQTTVCTVIGFEASRGEKVDRGPFAMVILEDANGQRTSVKTRNDEELEAFRRAWDQRDDPARLHPGGVRTPGCHPAIGRKLRIEFQDFTPKAGYRHPRWDRWEDE